MSAKAPSFQHACVSTGHRAHFTQVESKECIIPRRRGIICFYLCLQKSGSLFHFIRRECWNQSESIFMLCLFSAAMLLVSSEEGLKKKGGCTECTNVALHTTLKPCSLSCFMQNVIFSKCFLVYRLKTRFSVLLHSVRYWIHKILSKKTKGEQKCRWVALAPWIKYYTYRFNYEPQLLSGRNIKCKLLCSLAGFLFLDFPWGEFSGSVGGFFFMTAVIEDFGAEKNYKNTPCVSVKLRSCSRWSLFSIQPNALLASVLASQGFALWQKCVCVVSGEQRLAWRT